MASYDTSVLYALGRPMLPRAFRWKPEGSTPSTKVTSYDTGRRQRDPGDEKSKKKPRDLGEKSTRTEAPRGKPE